MSTQNDNQENKNLLPESSGIVVGPVAWFLIILTISTAFTFVLIKGLTYMFGRLDAARNLPPATRVGDGGRLAQREPLLQGAPAVDSKKPGQTQSSLLPLDEMREYRKQVEAQVNGEKAYGWVEGKQGSEAH